jgi:hypothetical protein
MSLRKSLIALSLSTMTLALMAAAGAQAAPSTNDGIAAAAQSDVVWKKTSRCGR